MAKDLKAQLEITADASGVEAGVGKAKKSLASLGATAATEGKKAADGIEKIGRGSGNAAQKVERDQKQLINSIQRTTAAMESGGRGSVKYFELLASQRGIDAGPLKPYLDQLRAVETAQASASAALAKGGTQFDKYGLSAKQTAAAMRQVPAQLTDIIVGLQGGQAPLTVLLQQGGQLKDVFGGVVPAAKALGGALLGLINPYTVAASAVAALGFAYFQGSKESDAFAKSIILSGNAAGVTVGQLTEMSKRLDDIVGTQSAAAAALAEFAASGNIAGANLERFTLTALRMEKVTGQAVKETVKQFAELGKSPVEAAAKLNESTNFLTASVYQQIRALEEQGRTADAAAVAQKAYADALDSRLNQVEGRLGAIERGWRAVVGAAKEAWDAMLNVGRPETLDSQLQKAQERLAQLRGNPGAQALANRPLVGGSTNPVAQAEEEVRILQSRIGAEARLADYQARSAAQVKARIDFDKDGVQFLKDRQKMEVAIAEARAKGAAANASTEEIEKRVAAIREKYADKSAGKKGLLIDKAELNSDLSEIKAASEKLIGTYAGSERILESIRSAGMLSDREYYEAKRAFINLESQAKEDALIKEIDRRNREKLKDDKKIENDTKRAEAEAKLAMVRADASSQLAVLANQEAAAQTRVALAYLTARQAAEDYLETQARQQDRMLSGIGQGNQQRGRDSGVNQIEDRYASLRRDLENQRAQLEFEGKFTEEARDQYAQRLAIINEFQAKSITSFTGYYDKLIAAQGNWVLGAQEALRNYADESKNVFSQVGDLISNAFRGAEDALVKFASTGKLSVKSLADSIIGDLARIAVKQGITGPLVNMLMGAFGGGGSSGTNYGLSSGGGSGLGLKLPSLDGGGYTGSGSRSGGMDGKGGFLAVMHPNETVIDHTKGGGGVSVTIINQSGTPVQATAQQRGTAPDGSQMLEVLLTAVADTINNGSGPVTRAMESRFGLKTAVS